ncbi:hypothetical protein, conserved [Babesia bigemina]|uniref:Uncharacterized protein n=1 Tax=Babesia bigemina TaxID=5866 RepID=A0A061D632_BABBI|nr:hypothetical protein, conserved [Babesia bigemina]CDR96018.1 hypothetical protein, conserved [Babesia bigemina]|eukprot:XP_012768204.1 hypothetical protein, conserved [Babesia bigemina]
MKLRRSKLQRIKRLAPYAGRSPAQAKLDKLWGFKPIDVERKDVRRKAKAKAKKVPLTPLDKVEETFAALEKVEEQQDTTVTEPENHAQDKQDAQHRKPWQLDPETARQKRAFKEAVNDLHNLVYPHLDPIAKRQYTNAKLIALGGKIAKNRKMPYNEFMQRSRALKRHVEKNKELEKELGVKLFTDTKGGSRFVDIERRKRIKELKNTKSPFHFGDRNGVYRIKPKKNR